MGKVVGVEVSSCVKTLTLKKFEVNASKFVAAERLIRRLMTTTKWLDTNLQTACLSLSFALLSARCSNVNQ